MNLIEISAYTLAQRFVGIREARGATANNPQILAMLRLDVTFANSDEVPWCSAFVNYVAWLLRLPRSKNLRARSWLSVGKVVAPQEATAGFDVAVLKPQGAQDPRLDDLNFIDAPGHVGFFSQVDDEKVWLLGGNQGDSVSLSSFPKSNLLAVRRLA